MIRCFTCLIQSYWVLDPDLIQTQTLLTWAEPFLLSFISASSKLIPKCTSAETVDGQEIAGNKIIWGEHPAPTFSKKDFKSEAVVLDTNRRRIRRQDSCFCWQYCIKSFQHGLYCQGLFSFGLGLVFPLCVLTVMVEGEGGWGVWEGVGVVLSSPLLGASPGHAVPWRRDVPEELRWSQGPRRVFIQTKLSSPTHHPVQMAAYKTCFLWWDSWRKAADNETHRLAELEKTKPFNTCLYAFLIKARAGLIFRSQKSIDKASNKPSKICSNKSKHRRNKWKLKGSQSVSFNQELVFPESPEPLQINLTKTRCLWHLSSTWRGTEMSLAPFQKEQARGIKWLMENPHLQVIRVQPRAPTSGYTVGLLQTKGL